MPHVVHPQSMGWPFADPSAIVGDFDRDRGSAFPRLDDGRADRQRPGSGMLQDVGDRLLDDAQDL